MKKSLLLFMGVLSSMLLFSQSQLHVFQDWESKAGTQNFYYRNVTKTDGSGNVYVAGATLNASNNTTDILVAKYNSSGTQQWIHQYNGVANYYDFATAMALDASGNVYITGTVTNDTVNHYSDIIIIKYNSSGVQQWLHTYDGAAGYFDSGTDLFVNAGGVGLVGSSMNASLNIDFVTILYNSSGTQLWATVYDYSSHLNDVPVNIVKRGTSIYVSGVVQTAAGASYSWNVVQYNTSGVQQSVATSSGGSSNIDTLNDMVTDATGNIYVAGATSTATHGFNYDIIKLDSNLVIQWEKTYDGTDHLDDVAHSLKVDALGDVYVTGSSKTSSQGYNYLTQKYNSSGTLIWTKSYNDSLNGDDEGYGLELSSTGQIYVTGSAYADSLNTINYHTMKYDTAGTVLWSIDFDGNSHLKDIATNIAIDTVGNVIVAGSSETGTGMFEYATVRYVERMITNPKDFSGEQIQSSFLYYENKGQLLNIDTAEIPNVRYYTNSTYPQYYFMDDTLSMMFSHIDTIPATDDTLQRIDLGFTNRNEHLKIYPLEQQSTYLNYFLPQCSGGITEIYGHRKLIIPNLYNNIDLVYSSNENGLKYYFVVKPGGHPADIKMQFTGATSTNLSSNILQIRAFLDTISYDAPLTYQLYATNDTIAGSGITANWHNNTGNNYDFTIHPYDSTKVLIIEVDEGNTHFVSSVTSNQSLEWSTFFGGASSEIAWAVCTKGGNAGTVIGGMSDGYPFLGQAGTVNIAYHNSEDAFVAKFNDLAINQWIDYIGGSGDDEGRAITLDNAGNVYFVGITSSTDLIQASYPGMHYSTLQGSGDGFYVELNILGTSILCESYIGGAGVDEARGIALATHGSTKEVYIVGKTINASGFPFHTSGNYNQTTVTAFDGFIMMLDATNTNQWCTAFGGNGNDYFNDIATRPSNGNPVIVGSTTTTAKALTACAVPAAGDTGFPFCDNGGAYYNQSYGGGTTDNMIVEFDRTNQSLIWSTYFGGSSDESKGYWNVDFITPSIAITNADDIYIAGTERGYPTTFPLLNSLNGGTYNQAWGCSTTPLGGLSGYIARFDANRNQTWTSFIGGSAFLTMNAICTDGENVYLTGAFNSQMLQSPADYCTTPVVTESPICNKSGTNYMETNSTDARFFISAFDKTDNIIWSTAFGSGYRNEGYGLSAANSKLYLVGYTLIDNTLWDFNSASPLDYYKTVLDGGWDATIAKFDISHVLIGIDEHKSISNISFHLYPNPSDNYINMMLDTPLKKDGMVTITDVMGKVLLVQKIKATEKSLKFDVSNFAKGIYFIKLSTASTMQTAKFIKQ